MNVMSSSRGDEYLVRVPKNLPKSYNIMRFNAGDKSDIRSWTNAKLSRDLSSKKIFEEQDAFPEFGEGSEYGKKQKEEARRLKYGRQAAAKFKTEHMPWNLSVSQIEVGKQDGKMRKEQMETKPKVVNKDYTGKKEGNVGGGSVYFVLAQSLNNTFEAYPIETWCNFTKKIVHRTLTDEEVEAAWDKRDKILNHLNYMARRKLHINDEDDEEDAGGKIDIKKEKTVKKKDFKDRGLLIHDDEDIDFMSDDSESGDENNVNKKQKKKKDSDKFVPVDEEAHEDSDDGEHEGTEVAYASDESSENEEVNDSRVAPKGLDELDDLSSSSDEENVNKSDKSPNADDSASSAGSDLDIDADGSISKSAVFMQKKDKKKSSRPSTPTSELLTKRTMQNVSAKLEAFNSGKQMPHTSSGNNLGKRSASPVNNTSIKRQKTGSGSNTPVKEMNVMHQISEDSLRRILSLKPITTKDLFKKLKKTLKKWIRTK